MISHSLSWVHRILLGTVVAELLRLQGSLRARQVLLQSGLLVDFHVDIALGGVFEENGLPLLLNSPLGHSRHVVLAAAHA